MPTAGRRLAWAAVPLVLLGLLAAPAVRAASPFAIRGVVEGYYGPPWSEDATLAVLRFMAAHGMNTFVYAPKFDPYQRADWRQPYPPDRLAALATLVRAAESLHIDFVYSISPGLSITYSSPSDRAALEAKIAQLRGIGVHDFMLSFDDIGYNLSSPQDQERYHGSVSLAQTDLTNAIYAAEVRLDPRFHLMFTPTDYWGTTPSIYFTHISHLNPHIDIVWTGPGVVSPTITVADAQAIARLLGRPPLIWYNYPVNDWTVPSQEFAHPATMQPRDLFLGPVRGLAPDLGPYVRGILANPMLEPYATLVPLGTLASYLQDPSGYRPDAAWRQAIAEVAGPAASAFATFAAASTPYPEILPGDRWAWSSTDPAVDRLEAALLATYARDPQAALAQPAARSLAATFAAWVADAPALRRLPNAALAAEIAPWVAWMAEEGHDGQDALRLLRDLADRSPAAARDLPVVRADAARLSSAPVQFGGDLEGFLTAVAQLAG
jgi:hyaluronoglucosaminidase